MVLLSIFVEMVPTVMYQLIYNSPVMIWSQVWLISLPLITINISLLASAFWQNSIAFQYKMLPSDSSADALYGAEFMTINGEAA